jgi:hypothetical protein
MFFDDHHILGRILELASKRQNGFHRSSIFFSSLCLLRTSVLPVQKIMSEGPKSVIQTVNYLELFHFKVPTTKIRRETPFQNTFPFVTAEPILIQWKLLTC